MTTPMTTPSDVSDDIFYGCGNETRILLLGKEGSQKCTTRDIILESGDFESSIVPDFAPRMCQRSERMTQGKNVVVINTPDFFDKRMSNAVFKAELTRWQLLSSPGPHAILLVMDIDNRPTDNEIDEISDILQSFGEHIYRYIIVVFTRYDIETYEMTGAYFKSFLERCDNRPLTFRNIATTNKAEALQLIFERIEGFKNRKDNSYFRNTALKAIEKDIRSQMVNPLRKHKEDRSEYFKRQIREEARKLIEGRKYFTIPTVIGVAANTMRNFRLPSPKVEDDDEYGCGNETRIVLLGKTGWGKSATGNTILGDKQFTSYNSPTSITTKCKSFGKMINGKYVLVIDTPGLFDTKLCEKELGWREKRNLEIGLRNELLKWKAISAPGPHAILLVLSVKTRQTGEEIATMQTILSRFGEDIFRYMIVVFTGVDDLERQGGGCDESESQGNPFEQYIQKLHAIEFFKKLLVECDNRIIAFKNIAGAGQEQVTKLFEMIEKMKTRDRDPYFRNKILKKIEKEIRWRIDQALLKENTNMLDRRAKKEIRQEIRDEIEKEGPIYEFLVECAIGAAVFVLASGIVGLCMSVVPVPVGFAAVISFGSKHCLLM